MSEPMTSPGDKQPPKDWWLENACRIAAFRLRQQCYMSANTVPIREQVRDCVEFLGRDRTAPRGGGDMIKSSRGNRLSNAWRCPHCNTAIDARTFRLDPRNATQLVCPNAACARSFAWKRQNKGKLWPEQRAYSVLR